MLQLHPCAHRFMEHFITGTKTPREAWEVTGHATHVNADEGNCKILFNFLRLACTLSGTGGRCIFTPGCS